MNVSLSLLKCLTAADDGLKAVLKCSVYLLVNCLVCLSEVLSSLGVTDDDICYTHLSEPEGRDLTCESTLLLEVAVLSCDLDVGVSSCLKSCGKSCERNAESDLSLSILNEGLELVDKLSSVSGNTAVHLPVTCCECSAVLLVEEAIDTGKYLTLDELERSAAACGDVGYLISEAELLDSSCGITAADDGDSVRLSNSCCKSLCTYSELLELEYACRTVPDNCLSAFDLSGEFLDSLRTDVETFPSVRDLH